MKILIADDHEIVRRGLVQIIQQYNSAIEIIDVGSGEEALELAKDEDYDLFVLDISMPGKSGLDVLEELKKERPKAKVLILSIHPGKEFAVRAFKLGANGYISKDKAAEEMIKAIDAIKQGRKYIAPEIAEKLLDLQTEQTSLSPHELLSDQEFKVFIKLADGVQINEIAESLFLSPKTVSTYKKRILDKMSMKSISDLTKYAISHNLL